MYDNSIVGQTHAFDFKRLKDLTIDKKILNISERCIKLSIAWVHKSAVTKINRAFTRDKFCLANIILRSYCRDVKVWNISLITSE
jgi:hypothetical protein